MFVQIFLVDSSAMDVRYTVGLVIIFTNSEMSNQKKIHSTCSETRPESKWFVDSALGSREEVCVIKNC